MFTTFKHQLALNAMTLVVSLFPQLTLAHGASVEGEPDHQHTANMGLKVTIADYVVPDVWVVRDDGKKVLLTRELDDGRPTVLNFIYTTCPGICPLMSQVFSSFQERLGAGREKVHMVSISIDPEQDTPARLRAYARQFGAENQWQHYTGTVGASIAAQKAFGAYNGDKMSHDPLTFMRAAPGKPWVRIDGFATADDLLAQYIKVAAVATSRESEHAAR
jgi:protein SCO1/2